MIETSTNLETPIDSRSAVDALATLPVDELRRLAAQLDDESRIVRSVLRERTRRPKGLSFVEANP